MLFPVPEGLPPQASPCPIPWGALVHPHPPLSTCNPHRGSFHCLRSTHVGSLLPVHREKAARGARPRPCCPQLLATQPGDGTGGKATTLLPAAPNQPGHGPAHCSAQRPPSGLSCSLKFLPPRPGQPRMLQTLALPPGHHGPETRLCLPHCPPRASGVPDSSCPDCSSGASVQPD